MKKWFNIMWRNFYIQLFVLAIVFLSVMIVHKPTFYSNAGFYFGISIPIAMMLGISYFGFYKFWKYIKDRI